LWTFASNSKELVRIYPDGRVVKNPEVSWDEAALVFWDTVERTRAPQPSVPSGEAVAWAPQLVDGSMPLLVYASVDFRTVEQAVENFIKPEHWRVIPLYAAPPQDRVSEVTEAMAFAAWAECIRIEENATPFAAPEMWEQVKPAWMSIVRAALAPSRRAPSGDGKGKS
jgi:hypothetical protein